MSHGMNLQGLPGGGLRVFGSDYLSTVPAQSFVVGGVILNLKLNPTVLGERLRQLARLFEKFKFVSVQITFQTANPTSVSGSVIGYFDVDTRDPIIPGEAGVRQAASHQGSSSTKLWANHTWIAPHTRGMLPAYYIENRGSDVRLTDQYNFVLQAETPIATGNMVGTFHIHYVIDLTSPQLNNDSAGPTYISHGSSTEVKTSTAGTPNNATASFVTPLTAGEKTNTMGLSLAVSPATTVNAFYIGLPAGLWFMDYFAETKDEVDAADASAAWTAVSGSGVVFHHIEDWATVQYSDVITQDNNNVHISGIFSVADTYTENQLVEFRETVSGTAERYFRNQKLTCVRIPPEAIPAGTIKKREILSELSVMQEKLDKFISDHSETKEEKKELMVTMEEGESPVVVKKRLPLSVPTSTSSKSDGERKKS
jgi:hypothetical protein